jgi:hypothetical protein
MGGSVARLLWAAFGASVLSVGLGPLEPALGQTPKDVPAVAEAITQNFSLTGATAYPAADWCVQVETDQAEQWWPTYNGTRHQSLYGSRIKLYYTNGSGVLGFASIFLAIDFLKHSYYSTLLSTSNSRIPLAVAASGPPPLVLPSAPPTVERIVFPQSPPSICPKLEDFLVILFKNNFYSWKPDQNGKVDSWLPGCDPAHPDKCDYVTWDFAGRDHNISGTIRFPILIFITEKDADPTNPHPVNGYLTVGYGGNGGAG